MSSASSPRHLEQLLKSVVQICKLGAKDPEALVKDSVPDRADQDMWDAAVNAAKRAVPKMPQLPIDEESDPIHELSRRLEQVVEEWHYEGPIVHWADPLSLGDLLDSSADDLSLAELLEKNDGLGLRGDIVHLLISEPLRSTLGQVRGLGPTFLAGLLRVAKDFQLAIQYGATRPMPPEEQDLIGLLDLGKARQYVAFGEGLVLANEFPARVDRVMELARNPLRGPRTVSPYLDLLRRCFVAAFYEECVMICRSLLEDSLKAAFSAHGLEGQVPDRLDAMIDFAKLSRWLTTEQARRAHDVRLRANEVLHHGQTDLVKDIRGTIDSALSVVRALMEPRTGRS